MTATNGRALRRLTDGTCQRHDNLLPEWVNGWIGDLGKELFEVVVDEWAHFREAGQWRVVPHRTQGLLFSLQHGNHQHLEGLDCVT